MTDLVYWWIPLKNQTAFLYRDIWREKRSQTGVQQQQLLNSPCPVQHWSHEADRQGGDRGGGRQGGREEAGREGSTCCSLPTLPGIDTSAVKWHLVKLSSAHSLKRFVLVTCSVLTGPHHRNTNMEQPIQMLGRFWWRVQQAPLPPAARRRGGGVNQLSTLDCGGRRTDMRSAGPVDPLWGLNFLFFFLFFNLWMRSELPGQIWWVFLYSAHACKIAASACCSPVAPVVADSQVS